MLTPTRRSFSVEFAALDFGQADLTRYRYRLQGFDAGWTETGSDLRVASDGNLPRGDYRLQVQSSHRQGTWSARELTLPVRVLPAWWQTWWARGLAALAALALWMGVVQLRTGGPAPEDADLVDVYKRQGVDGSMRGSSIIFFMAASRVALSGHSTHEKATVSSAVACTARRKSVTLPSGTSSPQPSITRTAPSSMNIGSSWRACSMNLRLLAVGTAITKPSM